MRYWLRPIFSVTWREIRTITRYKSWFVASFLWPIIFPITFVFLGRGLAGPANEGLSGFEASAATTDFAGFLIIGNLVWMFVNINLWIGGLSLRQDKVRGTFDTHWTMPVAKLSLVLGTTFASVIMNFIPMVVSVLFYRVLGVLPIEGNVLAVIATVLLIMPFLFGFLFAFSAFTVRMRDAHVTVMVMRALFSLLCGLQFPIAVLPGVVQGIGRAIPLTHFVEVVRGIVMHGDSLSAHGSSILYMTVAGLVMVAVGVLLFETAKRSVRRSGLVTGY